MRTTVMKVTTPKEFTVVYDDSKPYATRYFLYIHVWKPNENGVYTKRKYLVDRVWDMKMCLAWIMDIINDERVLEHAISAKQILQKGA